MPQIFRRSANTLSKISIFGVLALVGGLVLLATVPARSPYVTRAHVFIEQPLQFSYMHHVNDDGIDSRYCHTSVEPSAFAEIAFLEPVRASFRDNRPLGWIRKHDQPLLRQVLAPPPQDFLEFDHGDQPVHDLVDAEARAQSPLV